METYRFEKFTQIFAVFLDADISSTSRSFFACSFESSIKTSISLRSTVSEVRHKIRSFGIIIAPSLSLVVADNVYTVSPLLFVNSTSLSFSASCVTLTGFSVFSPFSCAYTVTFKLMISMKTNKSIFFPILIGFPPLFKKNPAKQDSPHLKRLILLPHLTFS